MTIRGELIRVGGHDVKITRPDKILFPKDGITKQGLIDYYHRIAPWMLSHLEGRPLALERYPDLGVSLSRSVGKEVKKKSNFHYEGHEDHEVRKI